MPKIGDASRLLTLKVDETTCDGDASQRALTHPDKILAGAEGNAQLLAGRERVHRLGPRAARVADRPDGDVRFEVRLPGERRHLPRLHLRRGWASRASRRGSYAERTGDAVTAYASWNGATDVDAWQLLAGPSPDALQPIAKARRPASRPR